MPIEYVRNDAARCWLSPKVSHISDDEDIRLLGIDRQAVGQKGDGQLAL